MDEVLEIENRSFQFPWSEADFLAALRQRNVIGTVYESSQGHVHGFMVYELHKHHLCVLNLAVAPEVRRTGVGAAMVRRLTEKLSQQRRWFLETELRETNLPGQLFLSRSGWRAVKVLKKHYDETNEDAILFRYTLPVDEMPATVDGSNRISQYDDP
jgi:ribosomal-protein-alanine N-acetyltransferase